MHLRDVQTSLFKLSSYLALRVNKAVGLHEHDALNLESSSFLDVIRYSSLSVLDYLGP